MAINSDILIPYMNEYKNYLSLQNIGQDIRTLNNNKEEYKRTIAKKAAEILHSESWQEADIGKGTIAMHSIKAVHRNINLVGRFQVSEFTNKVKENYYISERILYNLFHDHKEQESFEEICGLFGRKYDLVAYLFFISNPGKYLPLRSSIFDDVFRKIGIDLRTSGRCSWNNYQEYLTTVAAVRDVMKVYYQIEDVDLLDAHSFLWTLKQIVLDINNDKTVKIGSTVFHKDYGKGTVIKLTDERAYIDFDGKQRIFACPDAIEKGYLQLFN